MHITAPAISPHLKCHFRNIILQSLKAGFVSHIEHQENALCVLVKLLPNTDIFEIPSKIKEIDPRQYIIAG